MQACFANFIKTGNPNGAGLPPWPAITASHGAGDGSPLMALDVQLKTIAAEDGARHAFQERQVKP
jgi:para-nitrobenzyl esterase